MTQSLLLYKGLMPKTADALSEESFLNNNREIGMNSSVM